MKVLLIGGDAALSSALSSRLNAAGHELLERAERAWEPLPRGSSIGLLVYDLGDAGSSAWGALGDWLHASGLPVIALGPARPNADHAVQALRMGADDYVARPVSTPELALRVEAVIRRAPAAPVLGTALHEADLQMEAATRSATLNGRRLTLTPIEYRLLEALVRHEGRLVPREALATQVWGRAHSVSEASLSLHMWNLRHKLEEDPSHPRLILTRRGLGYVYVGRTGRVAER